MSRKGVLDKFLEHLRELGEYDKLPKEITRENVNTKVAYIGWYCSLIQLAAQQDNHSVIMALLEIGSVIDDCALMYSAHSALHLLLHKGADPNLVLHDFYGNLKFGQNRGGKLLMEYGGTYKLESDYFLVLEHVMKLRMNRCRRAILTLIWIPQHLGHVALKSLFVSWAKQIWFSKPYTDDLQPSMGPRSSVWDLKESTHLSRLKKRLKKN
jgi:hypothetical protein